ncbi:MAG: ABC transporter permease, partial [Clostridia bacterium]
MGKENIKSEKQSFLRKIDWVKISMPILGILVGAMVGSIIIAAQGVNPLEAYYFLIQGAMGSVENLIGSLVKTIPLAITGLAVVFSYKANIFNVGAEGQLYLGAVAATLVGTSFAGLFSPVHILLALALAAVFGGALAFIPGYLKAYKGFNEIVVTMLLNYIAVLFISFLVQGPMKEKGDFYPRSALLEKTAQLPKFTGTQLHYGIIVMIVIAIFVYFIFKKTTLGYQIKAVGASPRAATYAGMN